MNHNTSANCQSWGKRTSDGSKFSRQFLNMTEITALFFV